MLLRIWYRRERQQLHALLVVLAFSLPSSQQKVPKLIAVSFLAKFSGGLRKEYICAESCPASPLACFLSSPLKGLSKAGRVGWVKLAGAQGWIHPTAASVMLRVLLELSEAPSCSSWEAEVWDVGKWKYFFIAKAGPNFTFRVSTSKTDKAIRGLSSSDLSF